MRIGYNPYSYNNNNMSFKAGNPAKYIEGKKFDLPNVGSGERLTPDSICQKTAKVLEKAGKLVSWKS